MQFNPASGKNILVMNDDPAMLQLFEDLLRDEGHRPTLDLFQRTTDAMLEVIRNQQPDLAIIDFGLRTEAKGRQLVEAMRADSTTRDIPVVVCAIPTKEPVIAGDYLNSPLVKVLTKPFDLDDVIQAVDMAGPSTTSQAFMWDAANPQMPGVNFTS